MPVSKGVDVWFCLFIIIESGERRESKPPGHLKSIIKPGIVIVKISGRNASKISFFPEALKTNLSQFYCCCSVAESCLTLQPHGLHHNRLTISLSLLSIMSIELVMLSNHLILCHPLLLPLPPPPVQSLPASGSFPMSLFHCTAIWYHFQYISTIIHL